MAAIKPDAPLAVQTINNGSKVVISWQSPSTNQLNDYGDYIDSYKVYIMHDDNESFSLDLINCDGENDQIVIQSTSCAVPLTTLQAEPFSIEIGK